MSRRMRRSQTMSNPLDLLNKIIGAIIAYGPKNKTKKARMARKAARRKKLHRWREMARSRMTQLGSGVCITAVEDDCLTSYSITSSAMESSDGGTDRPRARAV